MFILFSFFEIILEKGWSLLLSGKYGYNGRGENPCYWCENHALNQVIFEIEIGFCFFLRHFPLVHTVGNHILLKRFGV